MELKLAKSEDLGDILKLQLLAYKSEGQIYDDFQIPPGKSLRTVHRTQKRDELATLPETRLPGIQATTICSTYNPCFSPKRAVHPLAA